MFQKQGTPQPIHIASGLCEVCGSKPATTMCGGKMVCQECKEKMTSSANEN